MSDAFIGVFKSNIDGSGYVQRGEYSTDQVYYATSKRTDIVKYDGLYYLCIVNETSGTWNPSNWVLYSEFELFIPAGTTFQYFRGDKAWADLSTAVRASLSKADPITFNTSTGEFGLGHNTTNLQLTSNQLNTIQDIATTSSPTFANVTTGTITANTRFRGNQTTHFSTTFGDLTVMPGGFCEYYPFNFRFDQNALLFCNRRPSTDGITITNSGFTANEIDAMFSQYAGALNLYGKPENSYIEVTVNSAILGDNPTYPFVMLHANNNACTVKIEIRWSGDNQWVQAADTTFTNYTMPTSVAGGGGYINGVRWTFYNILNPTYLRYLGIFVSRGRAYGWTVMRGGDSMFGDLYVYANQYFGVNRWLSLIDSGSGNGRMLVNGIGSIDADTFMFRSKISAEWARFTNGNLGIGTTTPLSKLSILGNVAIGATYANLNAPTSGLIVEGNVGIGVASPEAILDINAGSNANSRNTIKLGPGGWGNPGTVENGIVDGTKLALFISSGNSTQIGINSSGSFWFRTGGAQASDFIFYTASANNTAPTERVRIANNGTVTIGDITLSASTLSTLNQNLSLNSAADIVFDPTGNDILPLTNYDLNLGAINKKYLSLHAAELWVENLVASNVMATIGGRIIVAPTTELIEDIDATQPYIHVKHNQFIIDDFLMMEGDGKFEIMQISNGPTAISGGFEYEVTRGLDDIVSGLGHIWYAGSAVVGTGSLGKGFIDIYSVNGINSETKYGPTIVGNVRNGSAWNSWAEHWAIGNLSNLYGQLQDVYGIGLGQYAADKTHILITDTVGLQIKFGTTSVLGQWDTSGYITIGDSTKENIYITDTAIQFRDTASIVWGSLSGTQWRLGQEGINLSNVTIDPTKVSFRYNSIEYGSLSATEWIIGRVDTDLENIKITSDGIEFRTNLTSMGLLNGSRWRIGQIADKENRIEIDTTNGIRILNNVTEVDTIIFWVDTNGILTIGDPNNDNINITSTAIEFRDGSTVYGSIAGANWTLGSNASGNNRITMDTANGIRMYSNTIGGDYLRFHLAADGSGSLATGQIAWTDAGVLRVGAWTVDANNIFVSGKIMLRAGGSAVSVSNLILLDATGASGVIKVGTNLTIDGASSGTITVGTGITISGASSGSIAIENLYFDGAAGKIITDATTSARLEMYDNKLDIISRVSGVDYTSRIQNWVVGSAAGLQIYKDVSQTYPQWVLYNHAGFQIKKDSVPYSKTTTITQIADNGTGYFIKCWSEEVAILFSVIHTGELQWGAFSSEGDTNLYRSTANTLRTDSNFIVDSVLTVNGNSSLGNANTDQTTIRGALQIGDGEQADGIKWGTSGGTYDTNLYRSAAATLRTDGSLIVGFNLSHTVTVGGQIIFNSAGTSNSHGLAWGTDVYLYRSAAATISVSGGFGVASFLGVGTAPNTSARILMPEGTSVATCGIKLHDVDLFRSGTTRLQMNGYYSFVYKMAVYGYFNADITADQDPYNPGGNSTYYVWRLNPTANRTISGIVAPATADFVLIFNVNAAYRITLNHDSSIDTPANGFLCPDSTNYTILPNSSVLLMYDSTSSRWRIAAKT